MLHLTRYIHLNPIDRSSRSHLEDAKEAGEYEWSSYAEYLGKRDTEWVKKDFVLGVFGEKAGKNFIDCKNYLKFVEDKEQESEKILGELILE